MLREPCISCNGQNVRQFFYPEGSILLCPACKLQYGRLLPTGAAHRRTRGLEVMKHFRDTYTDRRSFGKVYQYRPFSDFFRFLQSRFGRDSSIDILDVGCGNGVFMEESLRRGHNPFGVEINAQLEATMRPHIADRVIFGSAATIKGWPKMNFHVATFWDSFEHMQDGFFILDRIRQILRREGFVYLRVNNTHDIYNLFVGWMLRIYPRLGRMALRHSFGFPSHFWNFSRQGMSNLLGKYRWRIIAFNVDDTPAHRLSNRRIVQGIINTAYGINKIISGGKIANYYIEPF